MAGTYKAGTDVVDGTRLGAPQLSQAVDECKVSLASGWVSTGQAKRVGLILERFVAFTSLGFNVGTIDAATPAIAGAFVTAAGPGGNAPTIALMHLRRTALRLLFRSARSGGVDVGDPTLDLVLPPRSPLSTRPLTDDELLLCRSHAFWSLTAYERTEAGAFYFFDNPINRYAIGDRTPGLKYGADGSLEIYIQRNDPGGAKSSNWLPAPSSKPLALNMRFYLPKSPVLDGTYVMPAIVAG